MKFTSKSLLFLLIVGLFLIDVPHVVSPSTIAPGIYGCPASYRRNSFYASGKFWVFYGNGVNLVYNTSSNGITWSGPTTVRAHEYNVFSIWFDGTYLHYAVAYSTPIYYRRGLPNADGTISWSAAEQVIDIPTAKHPSVSVDSNGYVWIGYIAGAGDGLPYVTKSGNNDGTWGTTPGGFPLQLSAVTWYYVSPIPLTNGKMLVIYSQVYVKVRRWDGSAWASEVTAASSTANCAGFSAVAEGDDVHIVYPKITSYFLIYVKYNYATNTLSSEISVQQSLISASVLARDVELDVVYCFWLNKPTANHAYYKKLINGVWDVFPTDWLTDPTLTSDNYVQGDYEAHTRYIGFNYRRDTTILRFEVLKLNPIVVVVKPENTTYTSSIIPVEITASGGTIDHIWYNCKNGSNWIYASNQTYTTITSISGFRNGTYTFYGWANNTDGKTGEDTDGFIVAIPKPWPVPTYTFPAIFQWLSEGNMFGFLLSFYTTVFGSPDIFFSLIAMLVMGAIYIRTHSLALISVLWWLVGILLIAAFPLLSGLGILFLILGTGGLLWQLIKSHGATS